MGMISLNAGDLVQLKYEILSIDPSSGVQNVVGTVDLAGNGTELNTTLFKIHLLSVNCAPGVDMPCALNVDCLPCTPMQCDPCTPSPGNMDRCDK